LHTISLDEIQRHASTSRKTWRWKMERDTFRNALSVELHILAFSREMSLSSRSPYIRPITLNVAGGSNDNPPSSLLVEIQSDWYDTGEAIEVILFGKRIEQLLEGHSFFIKSHSNDDDDDDDYVRLF
jgi:hypothetical protein